MEYQALENILQDQLAEFLALPEDGLRRAAKLPDLLTLKESLVIVGVRRCGKSYLMRLMARNLRELAHIAYLDLDDPRLNNFDSDLFERVHESWLRQRGDADKPLCIFLDEPQNVEGWERWATYFAKQKNHHVVITGSNSTMLSSDLSTHLTGRHREIHLLPLSFKEVSSNSGNIAAEARTPPEQRARHQGLLEDYMKYGGFPRVFLDQDRTLLQQYFKDIIYKDIAPRKKGSSPRELIEIGTTLMSNNTRLTNKSKLSKQVGIKQPRTLSNYIQSFKDAFLFYEVRRFDASLRKQIRSLSKYYAVDPALAGAVGFRILDDKSSSLENLVALELIRQGYEIYYWTDEVMQWEVDFIARKPGLPMLAIQVALDLSDPAVLERETRVLAPLKRDLGINQLTVIVNNLPLASILKLIPQNTQVISFIDWTLAASNG